MAADKDAGTPRIFLARHGLSIYLYISLYSFFYPHVPC